MPINVKIIGAGSIGNHLAQAARRMGWKVCVVDQNEDALKRMKEEIYPSRYGAWDEHIALHTSDTQPHGGFDVIFLGTPPHVRMELALQALAERPRILQLEKPLAGLSDKKLREFVHAYRDQDHTVAIVGYDHVVAASIQKVEELLVQGVIGKPLTIDVEFREHWQGIFKAHPWLSGPEDSYLGYSAKGGGAGGEHSHALHLFQHLSRVAGLGVPAEVAGVFQVERHEKGSYDSIAAFTLKTDTGMVGRVVQDVVTHPTRKWARIQGEEGFIEWVCNGNPAGDVVCFSSGGDVKEEVFEKKRPDDFYREMLHIRDLLDGKLSPADSPLSFERGLLVLSILEAAWGGEVLRPIEIIE